MDFIIVIVIMDNDDESPGSFHHHQKGMDRSDIYEAELAELSELLNIESEEKEIGALGWVNAGSVLLAQKECRKRTRFVGSGGKEVS